MNTRRTNRAARRWGRWLVVGGGAVLALLMVAAAPGPQEAACPEGAACAELSLWPASLTADYFIGEQKVGGGNPAIVVVEPGTTVHIDARDVQDSSEGFGDAFVYGEAGTNVWIPAGQTRRYTLYPRKTYIKGSVQLTCDIRSVREGDNVACHPFIDAQGRDNVPPGEKATYNLEGGPHAVRVEVVGNTANLWDPPIERTVNVSVGGTRYERFTFNKLASLTIALNEEGIKGDLYVDDEMVAGQATTAQLWVTPYQSHRVEIRNITDPASDGAYGWRDASGWAYLSPGQERTVTLYPQKGYVKGFLRVRCNMVNHPPENMPFCRVTVDGQKVDPPVQAGESVDYALFPGRHEVEVFPGPQSQWVAQPHVFSVNIWAGGTANVTATYNYGGTCGGPGDPECPTY